MISIRRYSRADHEVLRGLVLQLHESRRPFDVDLAPGDQIIDPYFNELISKLSETGGVIFIAEDKKSIVGYACLRAL